MILLESATKKAHVDPSCPHTHRGIFAISLVASLVFGCNGVRYQHDVKDATIQSFNWQHSFCCHCRAIADFSPYPFELA